MKRILPLFSLLCALAVPLGAARARGPADADSEKPNTLTADERAQGWQLLFDGVTTKGWREYRGKKFPTSWRVVDGTLKCDPEHGQGGDIVTTHNYGSFELAIEWKIAPHGNSGIMYHVAEIEPAPYLTGPEYQLVDNAGHPDGKHPITSAASCYAVYPPSHDATRPVGEWNKTRIVVKGKHVEHWLNGEKVLSYELGSPDWDKRVQASKFRSARHFGKEATGHIDLQNHGDVVAFRNIKIRVLDEASGQ